MVYSGEIKVYKQQFPKNNKLLKQNKQHEKASNHSHDGTPHGWCDSIILTLTTQAIKSRKLLHNNYCSTNDYTPGYNYIGRRPHNMQTIWNYNHHHNNSSTHNYIRRRKNNKMPISNHYYYCSTYNHIRRWQDNM
jgi:hypothetical protein